MSAVSRLFAILVSQTLVAISPLAVAGSLGVYTNEAQFDAAWPGLEVETFEEAMVGSGQAMACSSPLSSTTNDDCFLPGNIISGVSISDLPGPTNGEMAAVGAGWSGVVPSRMVAPNLAADRLNIVFDPPVRAVGFRLHTWGLGDPDMPTVRAYDLANVLIDTLTANSSSAGTFLGFDHDLPITRIEVHSTANSPEGIDDIRFHSAALIFRHGFESP